MTKSSSSASNRPHPVWAWFCIALGAYPLLIAFGVVSVQDSLVHAPMWVIGLCGVVFVCAGCAMLFATQARLHNLFGGLICLAFAAVGFWVAVFSPHEGFSGGIPFLSYDNNVTLARWLFGFGSVLTLAMFGHAMRLVFRRDA